MAGPWEQYAQTPTAAGPWTQYADKAAPEAPSNTAVFANALWKGAASLPDMVLNAPQNVVNLGRAAVGSVANLAGRPDLAPDIVPTADIVRRGAEKVGLINPNIVPQGGFQRGLDLVTQGAVGGALTGGGGAARTVIGSGMGALSAGAAGATEAVTGRPELGAIAGLLAPAAAAKVPAISESAARRLMQSALKPDARARRTGDADRAVTTNLEHGINVTPGGVQKLQTKIGALNDEISTRIADSTATVDKRAVTTPIQGTVSRFSNQVDPHTDLAAINRVLKGFENHPNLQGGNAKLAELLQAASEANTAKVAALHDAGRFQTFAAQQRSLAEGGTIAMGGRQASSRQESLVRGTPAPRDGNPPGQTPNEPYFNVGENHSTLRPTNRTPEGYLALRKTQSANADRAVEGQSAQADAMRIYHQRRFESDKANKALADFIQGGGEHAIPVQQAQSMKQGTYRALGDKSYGELKGAEIEAQKALARGLKDEVANAVPEIAPLNARESALINAKKLTEKRVSAAGNNNIIGIGALSPTAHNLVAFLLDRWGWSKSVTARALHSGPGAIRVPADASTKAVIPTSIALEALMRDRQ